MIKYDFFTLDNGLKVYVHPDKTTPIAVLNILYNVGSRDEDPEKTGFAHLFEHLMFGGSGNIPHYDDPLQQAGGENNAFTSADITNYYITIPANNLETAFWLESDRMLSLSFDPHVLEIQRSVVIEEFKQRYLNQPYGDVWLKLKPLAYEIHPYRWPTIGKEVTHIESANMEDVRKFFFKYYIPNNAILVVAGNVDIENVRSLCNKWFGPIPAGEPYNRNLPEEPAQIKERILEIEGNVPLDAIYKVYHMAARNSNDYYACDFLSDILGRGKSSRLYEGLVKDKKLFSSLHAHASGSAEPGLFTIEGKLNPGVSLSDANDAICGILEKLKTEMVADEELLKVKNQAESSHIFGEMELLNRAMNLAYSAFLGDAELVNKDLNRIQAVSSQDLHRVANSVFRKENCSTLLYKATKSNK